jgi:hypothetical protein
MGFEPAAFRGRPGTCPVAPRARIRRCRLPTASPASPIEEATTESRGAGCSPPFCEVAIIDGGRLRSAGRIKSRPDELELFAQSLGRRDRVALELTGNAGAIAATLEPHVARVIVVSPNDTGIR